MNASGNKLTMLDQATTDTKIVIFAELQAERDFLRRHLAGRSFTVLHFEKETTCFDNLKSIDPGLVILRTDSKASVWRFILAIHALNLKTSLLILSDLLENSSFTEAVEGHIIQCLSNRQLLSDLDRTIDQLIENPGKNKLKFNLDQPIIIGETESIKKVWATLPSLKRTRDPVLITGEPGTGKELMARAIVAYAETECAFIKIDCTELGAQHARNNLVRSAIYDHALENSQENGNQKVLTIFLQRVDSLDTTLQLEILMLIDDIQKFDAKQPEAFAPKVRFIATARPDLEDRVARDQFRKDLYYRLNVIPIDLPPLRERKEDIPLLADYFMIAACSRLQKSYHFLSKETKHQLYCHYWPGNVEEMHKLVHRIAVTGDESIVSTVNGIPVSNKKVKPDFHAHSLAVLPDALEIKDALVNLKDVSLKNVCDRFIAKTEKKLMQKALESTNWNRKKAAALLNISYKSMLNKMKMYEIV